MLARQTFACKRNSTTLAALAHVRQYHTLYDDIPRVKGKHRWKIAKQRKERGKKQYWTHDSQRALTHGHDQKKVEKTGWSGMVRKKFLRPNVNMHKHWSDILQRFVEVPTSNQALRKIGDKGYSFDRYILETKPIKLNSKLGEAIRQELQEALKQKEEEWWQDALEGDPEGVVASMKVIKREERIEWTDMKKREKKALMDAQDGFE